MRPEDAELDGAARATEKTLPDGVAWSFTAENVLGPGVEEFRSNEDWVIYRSDVKRFFGEEANIRELDEVIGSCIVGLKGNEHAWCTLVFHPADWDILVNHGLVSSERIKALRNRDWARLMALPKKYIEIASFDTFGYRSEQPLKLPLIDIFKVAAAVHNGGSLRDSELANQLLRQADLDDINSRDIYEITESLRNPAAIPDSWAEALIVCAAFGTGANAKMLIGVWALLEGAKRKYIWFRYLHNKREIAFLILNELLAINSDEATHVAAAISGLWHDLKDELSECINLRVADLLKKRTGEDAMTWRLVNCLLRTKPTLVEAELYADCERFDVMTPKISHFGLRVSDRIVAMPQTLNRKEFGKLRKALERIVRHVELYPIEVTAASIDALIQIDNASRDPLEERTWQLDQRDG